MGEQESGRALGQAVKVLSAAELARVSALSFWTEEEAAQVLLAQRRSGQSARAFATRNGFSSGRLYYWMKRLSACRAEAAKEPEQPVPAEESAAFVEEPELSPEALQKALAHALSCEAAGDRSVQQYVLSATRDADKMWRVFEVGATGTVLLCVVRWTAWQGPMAYSLVELERRFLRVRWREFATLREAMEAFGQRMGSRCESSSNGAVPLLLPVQVRDATQVPCVASARELLHRPRKRAVTVELPSGVRVRIPNGAEPELVHAVLETTLGVRS